VGLFFSTVLKNIKKYARSKILSVGFDDWNATRLRLAVHGNFDCTKGYLFTYQKNGTFFQMLTGKSKENNWF
jgi:hypothetical protein